MRSNWYNSLSLSYATSRFDRNLEYSIFWRKFTGNLLAIGFMLYFYPGSCRQNLNKQINWVQFSRVLHLLCSWSRSANTLWVGFNVWYRGNVFGHVILHFLSIFNSREAIAAIIGDIVVFFFNSSPSMILTTWLLGIDFLELTSVTSIALQLKFMYVTSFLLLGQLRDLPHLKKWLLNSLMEL